MLHDLRKFLSMNLKISRGSALLIVVVLVVLYKTMFFIPMEARLNRRSSQLKEVSQEKHLTEATIVGRDQEDPALVAYIRDHEVIEPSDLPYNLSQPNKRHFSQHDQSEYAEANFLQGLERGFFIEVGALEGELLSNTLFFEKYKGWTGLLIEPNPTSFDRLLSRHRKAYAIKAGLSLTNKSAIVNFVSGPNRALGRIGGNAGQGTSIRTYPLFSMLLALGVNQVDFFSLDIEGDEKSVLETIPWEKVKIRLFCIEINVKRGGHHAFLKFFQDRGYIFLGNRNIDAWFGLKELLQETMDVDDWLLKNNVNG